MNAYVFVLLFLCQLSYSQPLFSYSLHLKSSTHLSNVSLRIMEKAMAPTPVFLPGKQHGHRGLVGCSLWGSQELDMTERLHFHFSLSYIRERNGNPLQCFCLDNPRDRGAWWAAIQDQFSGSLGSWSQCSHSEGSGLDLWSRMKIPEVVCYGIK